MILRRSLLHVVAVLMTATIVYAQTPPSTLPTTMPHRPPMLPQAAQEQIRRDEDIIHAAWTHPTDLEGLRKAIAAADNAVQIRLQYQGAQWWETTESQDWLADLHLVLSMTPAQRQTLADAFRLKEAFDKAASERNYALAAEVGRKCIQQFASVLGPDHRYIADTSDEIFERLAPYLSPADMLQQAQAMLGIRQHHYTGDNPYLAKSLIDVASLLCDLGRAQEALALAQRAMAIQKAISEETDDPELADCLKVVAACYQRTNQLPQALDLYEESLAIDRTVDGDNCSTVADLFVNIGDVQRQMGRLEPACGSYESALRIEKQVEGDNTATTAALLNRLASCLQLRGLLDEALIHYEKALSIRQALHPTPDASVATALNNLGCCLQGLGDTADALEKFREAHEIQIKLGSTPTPETADTLSNIAYCSRILDGNETALPQFEEALKVCRQLQPPDPRRIANALNNLAYCQLQLSRTDDALANFRTALNMRRQLGTSAQAEVADTLNEIGQCHLALKHFEEAATSFDEALRLRRSLFPGDHPDTAISLSCEGCAQEELKNWDAARSLLDEAARSKWAYLTHTFPVLSDAQKQGYLTHADFDEQQRLVHFAVEGHCPPAKALDDLLLGKQLLFEVARQEQGQLLAAGAGSADGAWVRDWKKLQDLRRQYENAALSNAHAELAAASGDSEKTPVASTASDPARMQDLARKIEDLDESLRQSNSTYVERARLDAIGVKDVAQALRSDEALVEYTTFRPADDSPPHYAAFELHGGSAQVTVVDLGTENELNALVRDYRDLVNACIGGEEPSKRKISQINQQSAELYQRVLQPMEASLKDVHRLYIAPDGWLSLFPFEALMTGGSPSEPRYLIEDKEIIYLTTGRDLARLARSAEANQDGPKTAVLVGNPNFDASPETLAAILAGKEGAEESNKAIGPSAPATANTKPGSLGGTSHLQIPRNWEQKSQLQQLVDSASAQLTRLGWNVTRLCGDQATEEAVESLHAPQILQLATHGYMLGNPDDQSGWQSAFTTPAKTASTKSPGVTWGNPLLQSMLIMAGENKSRGGDDAVFYPLGHEMLTRAQAAQRGISGAEFDTHAIAVGDGCLTAYEVSGMDLHGTQFVNLTACDTGLGEITANGVAGLRQGFLLAGARSITMSMWEIPADLAPEEAETFYANWLGDATHPPMVRYKAFRAAELKLLAETRVDHHGAPHLWAGVVYVGDPGDLPAGAGRGATPRP